MRKIQHGVAVDRWTHSHYVEVCWWLTVNFGPKGNGRNNCKMRWGTEHDYGLDNLYMDDDVFMMYKLRWE